MKKSVPWIIAIVCGAVAVWAVGTRRSSIQHLQAQISRQKLDVSRLRKELRADEELRATHAAAERLLSQQEKRLHNVYEDLHPFTLVRTNMMLAPAFEMTVVPHIRSADITITISNASSSKAWLPPRYKIGFLNAVGFVSGEVESGWFNTWVPPGTNLTHQYQVSFDFEEPVYCVMKTMRQGSRNP